MHDRLQQSSSNYAQGFLPTSFIFLDTPTVLANVRRCSALILVLSQYVGYVQTQLANFTRSWPKVFNVRLET
jgi:hypothetical protein